MFPRPALLGLTVALGLVGSLLGVSPSHATVTATVISTAQYPLALDVDADGNVWIGYADGPMTPKGVTVVPAASGTLFGVSVTAGVETRLFDLSGIQGILRSPAGHLFVANESGSLYVVTDDTTTVFGVPTTAKALTLINNAGFFRGGLAMDSSGNLFGARKFQDGGGVSVLPSGATAKVYGQDVAANVPELLTPLGLSWGGWEGDLAIDSADNLFINTWYTAAGPQGVYVLPKVGGMLYGQSVDANTLTRSAPFNGVVTQAAGIDIDDSNNIYVSQYGNAIYALSPQTRLVMGQTVTANTATVIAGSSGQTGQGVAVAPDGSSLISGAFGSTRRLVPIPSPPVLSASPIVSGVADVGETLTVSDGIWSGDPAPAVAGYQWQRCSVTGPAGVDWQLRASPGMSGANAIAWGEGPAGGAFVAVSGFGDVVRSADGIMWTAHPPATNDWWTSVTWGNSPGGGRYVAVADSGAVMSSPDGITWTSQSPAAFTWWTSVTWGAGAAGELFVAVSLFGDVMTSPDGIAWTLRIPAASHPWTSVTHGVVDGAPLFVAVSAFNDVMTSPDGVAWTAHPAASSSYWRSVTWGKPYGMGLYVAVADNGEIMTSPNGNAWTSRVSASMSPWLSVAWGDGPGGGQFVAVAQSGAVMTSTDGIVWSGGTPPYSAAWTSVAWGGPDLDPLFAAVSSGGSGRDIMTSSSSLTCSDIAGETDATYLISNSDRGKTLRNQVTVSNIFGSVQSLSSGVGPVPDLVPPPAPPRIPPGPPLNVSASPTLRGATVTWSAPADPGSDGVNLYAVRAWPGGPVCQAPGIALSCAVTGLDPEWDYYFTVVPMSGAGWGAASQPSNTVRPLAPDPPGAPTDVVATPGDGQVTVTWTPPSSAGSSLIREYLVTSTPAGGSCVSLASPCTVTGLTNGTAYTFSVEARNDEGWGPASRASAAVTPQAPSVTISARRAGRAVELYGVATSIAPSAIVTVWWRSGKQQEFMASPVVVRVDQSGSFTWQRRINPAKRFEAYAFIGEVQSNTVVLTGKRAR